MPSYSVAECNRAAPQTNETFKSYIVRRSSLRYYVESGHFHGFGELFQFQCDRVKYVLQEGALGHLVC